MDHGPGHGEAGLERGAPSVPLAPFPAALEAPRDQQRCDAQRRLGRLRRRVCALLEDAPQLALELLDLAPQPRGLVREGPVQKSISESSAVILHKLVSRRRGRKLGGERSVSPRHRADAAAMA